MLKNFLEKTYNEINDNIKFLEAKNATLITLNGVLISAASDKIFNQDILISWRILIALTLILLLIPLLISTYSFSTPTKNNACFLQRCKLYKNNSNNKFMYYSYIHKNYSNGNDIECITKYINDIKNAGIIDQKSCEIIENYEKQLANQIIDLSNIAYRKSLLFNIAIKIECIFLGIGGVIALIIIFSKIK